MHSDRQKCTPIDATIKAGEQKASIKFHFMHDCVKWNFFITKFGNM